MSGVWEGGCEKERVMMVEAGDLGNHEEARKMKVGSYNIIASHHHEPSSFSRIGQVNICWRMEARSSNCGNCGNAWRGAREHGEGEAASGG